MEAGTPITAALKEATSTIPISCLGRQCNVVSRKAQPQPLRVVSQNSNAAVSNDTACRHRYPTRQPTRL
jgi:hypothetical protein